MDLILVRHGETEANVEGRIQGQIPSPAFPLSETGVAQAKKLRDRFAEEKLEPTHLFSSPLLRARETAEIVSGQWPIKINNLEDLMEHDLGIASGLTLEEVGKKYSDIDVPLSAAGMFADVRNAETIAERRDRGSRVVKKVISSHQNNSVLVMFTHGGIIQDLVAAVLQTTQRWGIPVYNTAVFSFTIDPADWRKGYSPLSRSFRINSFNDASHL